MTENFFTNALIEIAARNELRREAWLPLLSPAKEARRMYQVASEKELNRYEAVHGRQVLEQVLTQRQIVKPNFLIGMATANEVRQILKAQLRALNRNR